MLVLPVACLLLLRALLPTTAPPSTNEPISFSDHQLGRGEDAPPPRARPAMMGMAAKQHQVTGVVADVNEEPSTEDDKTFEQLFEMTQKDKDEQSRRNTEEDPTNQTVTDVGADVTEEPSTEEDKAFKQLIEMMQKDKDELSRRDTEEDPPNQTVTEDVTDVDKEFNAKRLKVFAEMLQMIKDEPSRRAAQEKLRAEEQQRRQDEEMKNLEDDFKPRVDEELLFQQAREQQEEYEVQIQHIADSQKMVDGLIASSNDRRVKDYLPSYREFRVMELPRG